MFPLRIPKHSRYNVIWKRGGFEVIVEWPRQEHFSIQVLGKGGGLPSCIHISTYCSGSQNIFWFTVAGVWEADWRAAARKKRSRATLNLIAEGIRSLRSETQPRDTGSVSEKRVTFAGLVACLSLFSFTSVLIYCPSLGQESPLMPCMLKACFPSPWSLLQEVEALESGLGCVGTWATLSCLPRLEQTSSA